MGHFIGTTVKYIELYVFSTATHLIHSEISAANTNRILASFHKTSIHILYSSLHYMCVYNTLWPTLES